MTLQSKLIAKLPLLVTVLFVIQPVLDVISFWLGEWNAPGTITLLMRLGVFGLTLLLGFCLSQRKWIYWVAAGICGLVFACHVWACTRVGYGDIMSDVTNFVRIIQMPLTVLCLITFMRRNGNCFEGMQLGLTGALLIIFLVELLSVITGTDPHTYEDGYGTLGWFNNTNSQSNNLTVLLPISLGWQLCWKKHRPVLFWSTAVLGAAALFFLCPRLAYLGILASTAGLCVVILMIRKKDKRIAAGLGAIAILFLCLIPVSPMFKHAGYDEAWQNMRQGWISKTLGEKEAQLKDLVWRMRWDPNSVTEEEYTFLVETLTPIYAHYIPDFTEIFGAEATMKMYRFTYDVRDFAAVRPKKLMFARLLLDSDPVTSRMFGLELSRFTVDGYIFDVENDFHGISYLSGWLGIGVSILFLGYFIYLIVWALVKDRKKYFTMEAAAYGIALLMCLAHVYNTAGVLRRPNASIFLSAILAGVYYLVRLREYPQPEQKIPEAPEQNQATEE